MNQPQNPNRSKNSFYRKKNHNHHKRHNNNTYRNPNKSENQNDDLGNEDGHSSKNRRPKTLSGQRVIQKYDNLLDQHNLARKKYFELFSRSDSFQRKKLEQNFYQTLEALRNFENELLDWQKAALISKTDSLPLDTFISTKYNEKTEQTSFDFSFGDPHLLPTQEKNFSDDKEESIGTIEDYKSYKGIA